MIPSNLEIHIYSGKANVHYTIQGDDFEEIYDTMAQVTSRMRDLIDYYDSIKEVAKEKTGKLTEEDYVGLFLISNVTYGINTDMIIGRPNQVIYTVVGKVLKRINKEMYERLKENHRYMRKPFIEGNKYDILVTLYNSGYLRVTGDGDVVINGKKRLSEILGKIRELTDIEKEEIKEGVIAHLLSLTSDNPSRNKELATPKIYSILITNNYIPKPEELTWIYNGEPIWYQLPDLVKIKYIGNMYVDYIDTILNDEKLRTVYKDTIDVLESRLVQLDNSRGTLYFVKKYPRLVTGTNKIKLVRDGKFIGIRFGQYVAQLSHIDTSKSKKLFTVYNINDKIGVPVKANTAEEAVDKVNRVYNQFKKEVDELRKLEVSTGRFVRLWREESYGDYAKYTVIVGYRGDEYPLIPGVLEKVKEKLREYGKLKEKRKEYLYT